MGTQRTTFTANSQQILREMEKMRKASVKNQEELKKLRTEGAKGNKKLLSSTERTTAAIKKQGAALRTMIGGYAGVSGIIGGVNQAIDEMYAKQEKSAALTKTVAQADAAIMKNRGKMKPEEIKSFLKEASAINISANFGNEAQLKMGASSLLSATGGDSKKTLEILRQAAPFFRDAPEQLATFGGSLADVNKSAGGSIKESLALVLGIQGQSRITDLQSLKNFSPAASQSRVYTDGADRAEQTRVAGALFAALGSQMGDVEGASTSTAVIALQKKLESTFPELDAFQDKLAAIRLSDQKTRDQFLEAGFEAKAAGVIAELINNSNSQTAKNFEDALSNINASEKEVDVTRRLLTGGTSAIATETKRKSAEALIQDRQLKSGDAVLNAARKITIDALAETRPNNPWAAMKMFSESLDIRSAAFNSTESQIGAFMMTLNQRITDIENRTGQSATAKSEDTKFLQAILGKLGEMQSQAIRAERKRQPVNGGNQGETQ